MWKKESWDETPPEGCTCSPNRSPAQHAASCDLMKDTDFAKMERGELTPGSKPTKPWYNYGSKVISTVVDEYKLMKKDDDEEEFFYEPESIPEYVPEPVKEPAREPAKEPVHTGAAAKEPEIRKGVAIGYRVVRAAKLNGQYIFHSPQRAMAWERGGATAGTDQCGGKRCSSCSGSGVRGTGAACKSCEGTGNHIAPDKDCDCGLYAKHSEESLVGDFGAKDWITQVEGRGKVHTSRMASDVIRMQHMQITGIRPPKCEQCTEPSTYLISANDDALSGRPTCDEHKPDTIQGGKIKVIAHSVQDIAKQLSNYYGGAKIVPHGKDWDDPEDDDLATTASKWARVGWREAKQHEDDGVA